MADRQEDFDDAIQSLIRWISGRKFGSVSVRSGLATIDRDAEDEVALFLTLTVSDPVGGATWPIQDVLSLRRGVLARARELQLSTPVYVRLNPVTDVPQEDDTKRGTGT